METKAEVVTQVVADPNFIQSLAIFMVEGGIFMWVILAIWLFGLSIAIERIAKLYQYDINGNALMSEIKKNIMENNIQNAITICSNSKAALAQVLKNALKRANQTKESIVDTVDATILEIAPQIEKRLNYLSLMANVSTLLGLLGQSRA